MVEMKKVNVSDDDCNSYVGRKIKIEKGDQVYVGTVSTGLAFMANTHTTVVRASALQTKDQKILEFVPSDGWKVYELD
jgi:hypothetical protein